MKISKKIYLISFVLVFLISCGSITTITGYWNTEEPIQKTYKKIGTIAVTSNIQNRKIVEEKFSERFITNGYQAIECSKILSPDIIKKKDKNLITNILKDNNIDGFLIVSILNIKEGSRYIPGASHYYPSTYYNSYYDYYYYNYDRVYVDGYYEKTIDVFLESNFYDVASGKLMSTMQTETMNPSDIYDLADSFSETIVKALIENKIISKIKIDNINPN